METLEDLTEDELKDQIKSAKQEAMVEFKSSMLGGSDILEQPKGLEVVRKMK